MFQNDRLFVLTKKQAYDKGLGEGEVWSPATPIVQMLCYPHISSHHSEWTTRIVLIPLKEQSCVLSVSTITSMPPTTYQEIGEKFYMLSWGKGLC